MMRVQTSTLSKFALLIPSRFLLHSGAVRPTSAGSAPQFACGPGERLGIAQALREVLG